MISSKYTQKRKFIHSGIIETNYEEYGINKPSVASSSYPLGPCDISDYVAMFEIIDLCLVYLHYLP